jgi:two-component system, NtrC family, sensor kinase
MRNPKDHKILFVDDEIDSVRPLMRLLEIQGYRVEHAPNTKTAIESIEAEVPDLMLLDVTLGPESGFDLFRDIRSLPVGANIPILFLSGHQAPDNKITGLNLGAGDFIVKPYNLKELVARIVVHLRLHDHEKLLKARNEELSRAYEELRAAQSQVIQAEKLATIGRLSANIVHEISTPLSFIISNLKMLAEYMRDLREVMDAYHELAARCAGLEEGGPLAARAREILELCDRVHVENTRMELRGIARDCLEGCEIIERIANDLREFSRDEYEELAPSDLNLLLDKALTLVKSEVKEQTQIHRDYSPLPLMDCIPSRMTQLFINVLLNAAQAITGHGVVHVKTQATPSQVIVTVKDTGKGIAADQLPHIFEPFFTTKTAEKGTGLGLSIAQKIVAFHQGVMIAKSVVGQGTEIMISFPVNQAAESGDSEP